ncbi:RNA polymerase B [Actinomortierella wolfii]|nr:RNA polymerase B [Actinomortierella wolfii]KAG0230916.1 RNA polymerase B [Actinomortierella wolfii]
MSSRRGPHRRVIEEEDATTLKLGEGYEDAACLFISEVKILLEATQRPNTSEVYQKTLNYVNQFNRFTNADVVREVRNGMNEEPIRSTLKGFELTQLANLCCEEAEEAKALVPSLANKIDDDTLQNFLNTILDLKKFQT